MADSTDTKSVLARLLHAKVTAINDDVPEDASEEKRARHAWRIEAMADAYDCIEALSRGGAGAIESALDDLRLVALSGIPIGATNSKNWTNEQITFWKAGVDDANRSIAAVVRAAVAQLEEALGLNPSQVSVQIGPAVPSPPPDTELAEIRKRHEVRHSMYVRFGCGPTEREADKDMDALIRLLDTRVIKAIVGDSYGLKPKG